MFSESEFLEWLRERVPPGGGGVLTGIGDDAAVVAADARGPLVLSSDQTVGHVHFVPARDPWRLVGRKALARNLSDLAAMGARPWLALASVSVPSWVSRADLQEVFQGLLECAAEEETVLVGGDLARAPHDFVMDVCVVGCLEGRAAMLRSGAREGDALLVTGVLGGAQSSGHHLRFRPRWREGIAFASSGLVHAAMDLSDGLGRDLPILARESGRGACLHLAALPQRRRDGVAVGWQAAVGDGEDFELLLAVAPGSLEVLRELPELQGVPLTSVGHVCAKGLSAVGLDGAVTAFPAGGYEHQLGD